jgi:hypothetical protein
VFFHGSSEMLGAHKSTKSRTIHRAPRTIGIAAIKDGSLSSLGLTVRQLGKAQLVNAPRLNLTQRSCGVASYFAPVSSPPAVFLRSLTANAKRAWAISNAIMP